MPKIDKKALESSTPKTLVKKIASWEQKSQEAERNLALLRNRLSQIQTSCSHAKLSMNKKTGIISCLRCCKQMQARDGSID